MNLVNIKKTSSVKEEIICKYSTMTKEEQILLSVNDRELLLKMKTSHLKRSYKVIETSVSNS